MAVVSVSRRCDVPAYQADQFMQNIRSGGVYVEHPYSRQVNYVSLHPDDVTALVFWSKNYAPLERHFEELRRSYHCIFHYTITGLPRSVEPDIPPYQDSIDRFISIAKSFSPDHSIWRYDPVIFCDEFDEEYHIQIFERIARQLAGYTFRCYTSFVQRYSKNDKRMMPIYDRCISDPQRQIRLAQMLADIAASYAIGIYACCCPVMLSAGIPQAHCIDKKQIETVTGYDVSYLKPKPSRKGCGCYASIDIGTYGVCKGGCLYCYAR